MTYSGQLGRVWDVMSDGSWHSLGDIREAIDQRTDHLDSEAAISARLRDLRKPKFGAHDIERRQVRRGLFEYRVILPKGQLGLFSETMVSAKS